LFLVDSQRAVAFELAEPGVSVEFGKSDFGEMDVVKRVPSFANFEDVEVAGDVSQMPVFGVAPSLSSSSVATSAKLALRDEEEGNSNVAAELLTFDGRDGLVPMEEENVLMATPKAQTVSTYSMAAITGIHDIEKMSGPLLKGYLKSVGIEQKGNRPELMQVLIREFVRFKEDPEAYLENVALLRASVSEPDFAEPSSGRRTKKRSLKAREADELSRELPSLKRASPSPGTPSPSPVLRSSTAASSVVVNASPAVAPAATATAAAAAPPPPSLTAVGRTSPVATNGHSPTQPHHGSASKKVRKPPVQKDPDQMSEETRLLRYEAVARQMLWARTKKAPPADKTKLLQEYCSLFGYNSQGVVVTPEEEQIPPPVLEESGSDLVGRRVDVVWYEDVSNTSKWYSGTIVKKTSRSHQVVYDDGDERAENLKTKKWRFSKSKLLDGAEQ
jgi:hypothetical protein